VDPSVTVRRILKALLLRGTHRSLGSPTLGTLKAFLSGILLIRIIVNLSIAASLWAQGSPIDLEQLAAAHAIVTTAYLIWVGALSSYNLTLLIPRHSFIDLTVGGERFRSRLKARSALLRPANWVAVLTLVPVSAGGAGAALYPAIALLVTGAATFLVFLTAERFRLERRESEVIQVALLCVIVGLNPDISPSGGSIIVRSIFLGPIDLPVTTFMAAEAIVTAIVLLLIIVAKTKVMAQSAAGIRMPARPVHRWYWRFVKIRFWILLYAVVFVILCSPFFLHGRTTWAITAVTVVALFAYLVFLSHCENELREKWRVTIFKHRRLSLFSGTAAIHLLLAIAPAVAYFLLRLTNGLPGNS